MLEATKISQFYFKDTSFADLMTKRIFNILLIANPYDAFMLEDDGRIDEKIFNEYTSLSLRYPPRFKKVSTKEQAFEDLENIPFDLVICMPGSGDNDTFDIARSIKSKHKNIPIVVLTPFSRGITKRIANEDMTPFDYIFCWLGNTDLILSIIKIIEDRMNLVQDIESVGVQLILVVEDSIRFYSSILPNLYKFVLQQSQLFATEALNGHQRTLRMRGRPKIVLARTYEEALDLYQKYHNHVLGVITDVRFPKEGEKDSLAGIKLCEEIRKIDKYLPLILQSSEIENKQYADQLNASFVDKNSKKMNIDLRQIVLNNFGFGDFIFRNPVTKEEVARVSDLKELQRKIFEVPSDSLAYHVTRDQISRWLYSRAMFPLAVFLKTIKVDDLSDMELVRKIVFDAIVRYREMKNQGVIAEFQSARFDSYSNFACIGEGSLGGKGRGLAFIDNMLKRYPAFTDFGKVQVKVPRTVVLSTDLFDQFMETNNLYQIALSDIEDELILKYFIQSTLPDHLIEDFFAFFAAVQSPIAIRSSSLLEDSHYQPFAGIYSTYMIPYLNDKYEMLRMLSNAIKGVYASVFFKDSKAYMQATSNVIDEEKMAVILQEVVGKQYENHYYPSFSGVARSLNYYPIGDEKSEEGTVSIALGLGKHIVEGGMTLRFCPHHPHQVLQTSEVEIALKETQTYFYALDTQNAAKNFTIDDGFNLLKLHVKDAEKDGSLQYIASTYDPYDQVIRDGIYPNGRKLITFANILQHDVFPLAPILRLLLEVGQKEMGRAIEMEFAVNLSPEQPQTGTFYVLQIRPIVDSKEVLEEDLSLIEDDQTLLRTNSSLGNGIISDVFDIVYVKTDQFSASNNQLIAYEIETLNKQFLAAGKNYILVGPGRWGSSDTWLGIPVKWPHISAARLIVEAGLSHYRIDPSQGTHFFQNLTSFGVGYFTINAFNKDGVYNQSFLDAQPACFEGKYIRHVTFTNPLIIKMDGRKNLGLVLLPTQ